MKAYYGSFFPMQSGGYLIRFKDIPEIVSSGKTLAECVLMGEDALAGAVEEFVKQGMFPDACSYEDALAYTEQVMQEGGFDRSRKAHVQLFVAPDMDLRVVRTSVSLRKCDLDFIDRRAKRLGYSRSEFMVLASKTYRDLSEELDEDE